MLLRYLLLCSLSYNLLSYEQKTAKTKSEICPAVTQVNLAAVPFYAHFKGHFQLGTGFTPSYLKDQDLTRHIFKNFSSLTSENAFKFSIVQPHHGSFDFSQTDLIVDVAQKEKKEVVGHTLIWETMNPSWLFKGADGKDRSRQELLKIMKDHIFTVMGRYRGKVKGWDVVNEAIMKDGTYRESDWYRIIGEDYILKAYQFAAEADPEAELYYNDYGLYGEKKLLATVEMIKKLQEQGLNIHTVGFQGHLMLNWPAVSDLERAIVELNKLGVMVAVTELDVTVLPGAWEHLNKSIKELDSHKYNPYIGGLPMDVEKKQADRYREVFEVLLRHSEKISRVTLWAPNDGVSWMNDFPVRGRRDYAAVFDRKNRVKKSYFEILTLLKNNNP